MKKRILNLLWRIQFKKVPYTGPLGYHCKNCVAGRDFYCGDFYCPLEKELYKQFTYRFEIEIYKKLILKWKTQN